MPPSRPPYSTATEHLAAEARIVRLLVERHAARRAARGAPLAAQLVATPEELRAYIDAPPTDPPAARSLTEEIRDVRADVDARSYDHPPEAHDLPAPRIASAFALTPYERQVLTLLTVAELDEQTGRILATLATDPTDRAPTAWLVSELLSDTTGAALRPGPHALPPSSPLLRLRLVEAGRPSADDGLREAQLARRPLKVASSIALTLQGHRNVIDERLARYARFDESPPFIGALVLPEEVRSRASHLVRVLSTEDRGRLVSIHGAPGCGRRSIAAAVASQLGRHTLELVLPDTLDPRAAEELVLLALRDAAAERAALIFVSDDSELLARISEGFSRELEHHMNVTRSPAFVVRTSPAGQRDPLSRLCYALPIPRPDARAREALWRRLLPEGERHPSLDLLRVSAQHELTGGQMVEAKERALAAARLRSPGAPQVAEEDIVAVAQGSVTGRMGGLGTPVATEFQWDDLIVDADTRTLLEEVVSFANHQHRVLTEWGFDRLLPYGRGLLVLFSGPPGTGKTMAASIIARALGRELYAVDLSRIVSKFIGETEKSLARVFDVAEETKVVLLFDEADALFGSRTQARSSTDRYANLEVNYLLQRVETYEGVVILTSNFPAGIDKAFQRRIRFHVQFPEPDTETRARLWQACIPPGCTVAPDVRFDKLADKFRLNGANIKNAVLRAAVRASAKDGTVTLDDLTTAAQRESQQLGLLVRHGA